LALRPLTLEICSHCGALAGQAAHGHSDAPKWYWRRVLYVPAASEGHVCYTHEGEWVGCPAELCEAEALLELLKQVQLYAHALTTTSTDAARKIGADIIQILKWEA
jgi:hypothetical protein